MALFLVLLTLALPACLPTDGMSVKKSLGLNSEGSGLEPVSPPTPTPAPTAPSEKVAAEIAGVLVARPYVSQVLREVFTSATYPIPSLESELKSWVDSRPSAFGLACDPYGSDAGTLCSGDVLSGSLIDISTPSSTVRQLAKSKICEITLSLNSSNGVKAAAEKIGAVPSGTLNEITPTILENLFTLFNRGRGPTASELTAYVTLNSSLMNKTPAVSKADRWQLILLMMCESPDWEAP